MHTVQMEAVPSDRYVVDLDEIDAPIALVGGKGANLAALSRLEGVRVPAAFCVTTEAYRRVAAAAPSIDDRLDQLSLASPDDRASIATISAEIRGLIETVTIPDDVAVAITGAVTLLDARRDARRGEATAYAVRSSATAEDLPTASFAGQQDSFLNITGAGAVLQHVGRCWASLFTERAVTYRQRNGIDHRTVLMAVVVQEMVDPLASGVMFTADPVTSSRKVVAIEATFGLGEAVVSGLVDADTYRIREDALVTRQIGQKRLAIVALADRRDRGACAGAGAAGAADVDRRPGRAAGAARPADRGAPRPAAGHRVVPHRRRSVR